MLIRMMKIKSGGKIISRHLVGEEFSLFETRTEPFCLLGITDLGLTRDSRILSAFSPQFSGSLSSSVLTGTNSHTLIEQIYCSFKLGGNDERLVNPVWGLSRHILRGKAMLLFYWRLWLYCMFRTWWRLPCRKWEKFSSTSTLRLMSGGWLAWSGTLRATWRDRNNRWKIPSVNTSNFISIGSSQSSANYYKEKNSCR